MYELEVKKNHLVGACSRVFALLIGVAEGGGQRTLARHLDAREAQETWLRAQEGSWEIALGS